MSVNIHNLYDYIPSNIFSKISNKQIIIYSIFFIVILLISKVTKKFSYVFIAICLFAIYIYYSQTITNITSRLEKEQYNKFIKDLEIQSSLISKDRELVKILYNARFIKERTKDEYSKMINYIEHFLILYESLKQNKTDIFLEPSNMIKSLKITRDIKPLLINDLRDQLGKILNHLESIIFNIPHHIRYLNSYYHFNQLLRSHLSRYYNRILSDNNFEDHTSQYQLIRSSENKYDFIY